MINEARALLTRARASAPARPRIFFRERFSASVANRPRARTTRARARPSRHHPLRFPPLPSTLALSVSPTCPFHLLAVFDRFGNQCAARSTAAREEKSLRVSLHASQRRLVAYLQISFYYSRASLCSDRRAGDRHGARHGGHLRSILTRSPQRGKPNYPSITAYTQTRGMNGEAISFFFFYFFLSKPFYASLYFKS